ncbi:MAG: hypothetical protein OXI96_09170 [Acidimicrobiaceae bacterium]|nr:hypothetical protein [Acidimicrobiaceae bacterium]
MSANARVIDLRGVGNVVLASVEAEVSLIAMVATMLAYDNLSAPPANPLTVTIVGAFALLLLVGWVLTGIRAFKRWRAKRWEAE